MRPSPNALKPARRNAVIQLAREGYSDYAIHEATGVSRSTIWRVRKAHRIPAHQHRGGQGHMNRVPRDHAARVSAGVKPRAASPDIRNYWLAREPELSPWVHPYARRTA